MSAAAGHTMLRPSRRTGLHPGAAAIAWSLLGAGAGPALLAQAPPTAPAGNDCTTSGCHAGLLTVPFVHGPTASGSCDVCHAVADEARHRFDLVRPGVEMCAFCHADTTEITGKHVHTPVAEGLCLDCHDPHGSTRPTMLRDLGGADPCLRCHQSLFDDRPVLHEPVATGRCTSCHNAHASEYPKLLVMDGRALCFSCHADVFAPLDVEALLAMDPLQPAPPPAPGTEPTLDGHPIRLHGPVAVNCAVCHDHHASRHEKLLVRTGADLCVYCHEDVGRQVVAAPVTHGAMTDAQACARCHNPHVGRAGDLLKDEPVRLCLDCHAKDVKRADGTVVAAVPELADPSLHRHGPLQEGSCGDCHRPHGAEFAKLLTGHFPDSFYQDFDESAYGLCFRCHDAALVTEARTTTATGFRDGDRNLHAVHVDAAAGGGRSCRVCHSPHASANPRLTRDWVSFGEWKLPIKLTTTETGGSCAAGCHRPYRYDRERAAMAGAGPGGADWSPREIDADAPPD